MRERLAAVVAALPDEIRRQILAAIPRDNPGKIDLLTEILDALPRERLLELVPRVDMTPGAHVRQFLAFLVKLVSLAAPRSGSGRGGRGAGGDATACRSICCTSTRTAPRSCSIELFTQTVEQFSSAASSIRPACRISAPNRTGRSETLDLSRYGDPQDRAAAIRRTLRALRCTLLRSDARDATDAGMPASGCATRRGASSRRATSRSSPSMAAVVDADRRRPDRCRDARARRRSVWRSAATPRAAERLMAALESQVGPASRALAALFLLSGLSAATLALARLSELPDGPLRDRLGGLLARLELDVVRQAITRRMQRRRCRSRACSPCSASSIRRARPTSRASSSATPIPGVRREALEVLSDAPLAPVKRERVMLRALNDDDRASCAWRCASSAPIRRRRASPDSPRSSRAPTAPRSRRSQSYAVAALRQSWTPHAIDALAPALLARRRAFDPAARRVSRAIVAALEAATTGARSRRRAPGVGRAAGVWSACRGDRAGAAS